MTSRRLLTREGRLLLEAADRIEQHGWCQDTAMDYRGRMCVLGALSFAVDFSQAEYAAAVGKILRQTDAFEIAGWNDAPGRTKDEVVAMLREAAIAE